MSDIVHQVDPDGDTVLILKNPGTPFAIWKIEPDKDARNEKVAKRRKISQGEKEMLSLAIEEEPTGVVDDDHAAIRYLVSSRHLALASGYFKSSLSQEGWMEGVRNEADGMYHLTTTDWDPDALLILLNILHLHNRKVPRELTLEMLAKMAVLIDYYRCAEATEVFTAMWIEKTAESETVPSEYNRDLVLWMCVAWVFKIPSTFETTTSIVIAQNNMPTVQSMDLPIPNSVLEAIENERHHALDSIFNCVQVWLDKWCSSDYKCSFSGYNTQYDFACSSMLIGALTKGLGYLNLSPRPETPFSGISVALISTKLQGMSSPKLRIGPSSSIHICNLDMTVKKSVIDIQTTVSGLRLDQFKDRAEEH
ncbi:hypothetical protein DM02DRAFT_608519 [Periconia macrospinosa]|uniref:BTB domain-containing protein n=1 Tax=Periconia macrospinosa TaxID=97972 RepID=A0A2V1ECZ9_9PLEO|nr:hypothetical protein DM02DRAFT_608519 [Periconia macrospinosa]